MLYQEKSCSIGEACCQDITGHMVFDLTKLPLCYMIAITGITKDGESMILRIDFNSDEPCISSFATRSSWGLRLEN